MGCVHIRNCPSNNATYCARSRSLFSIRRGSAQFRFARLTTEANWENANPLARDPRAEHRQLCHTRPQLTAPFMCVFREVHGNNHQLRTCGLCRNVRARRYKRAHGIFNGLFWDILVRELRNPLKNWATRNCRFQPWVIEFTWRQRVSFRGTVVVRDKLRPSIRIQGAMPNQMRQNFFQYRKKKLTIAVS